MEKHVLWRHPEAPRFHQRGEGSPVQLLFRGDPSLRLKDGSAQDDAVGGFDASVRKSRNNFSNSRAYESWFFHSLKSGM